jgi:secreted trypsin-like serine protease
MTNNTRASLSLSCSFLLAALAAPACIADLDVADVGVGGAVVDDEKAIVGGTNTTIEQNPWQVSLQQDGSHFCGGSIIAPGWVLTAQHCVDGQTTDGMQIVAGTTRLSRAADGQTRAVTRIVRYPGYRSPEYGRDVALLQLSSPLTVNARVAPVALAADADHAADAGVVATVTGWGTTRSGGTALPDQLKGVDVPVIGIAQAQQAYGGALTSDQLSAGRGGHDSCQGDSGGPLTAPVARGRVLVGVVSWGYGCGDANYPGLYARVTSFSSWIADQTGVTTGGGTAGGTAPTSPTTPSTTTASTLLDRDIAGDAGSFQHFSITVPDGAAVLEVVMRGGRGDADLYVRAGRRPTANTWDCRPYLNTADEVCTLAQPRAGTWYVSVAGYEAFTGAHLTASVR